MGRPKITIELRDGGYKFFIYPGNNHSQPLGQSAQSYPTFADCAKAKDEFITLVTENNLSQEDGRLVKIEKSYRKGFRSDNTVPAYSFFYFDESGECIFKKALKYCQKENCQKGIAAIFRAIETCKCNIID